MRITLQELELHRVIATKEYAPGALDYHGAEFRQVAPLRINVVAELQGDAIRVRGHLTTRLEISCDRCLAPTAVPVNYDFDLVYEPLETVANEGEFEVSADELEVGFYTGDGIELKDVATEQVILAVPIKVICREDCQGFCPVCKVNRNLTQCNCAPLQEDSPFASFKQE